MSNASARIFFRRFNGLLPRDLVIIAIHMMLLVYQSYNFSFEYDWANDEEIYMGAGSRIWHDGRVANKMTEYHPPLSFYLNSLFLGANPLDWHHVDDASKGVMQVHSVGIDIINQAKVRGENVAGYFFRARLPFLLMSLIVCFVIIRAIPLVDSRIKTAMLAMYALSPLTLAQVPAIATDFSFAFFSFALIVFLYTRHTAYSFGTCAIAGMLWALAATSKVSGLSLGLVFLILFFYIWVREKQAGNNPVRPALKRVGLVGGTFFISVWAIYGFQFDSIRNVEQQHFSFVSARRANQDLPHSTLSRYPLFYDSNVPAPSFIQNIRFIKALSATHDRIPIDGPLAPCKERWCPGTVQFMAYVPAALLTYFPSALWAWLLLIVMGVVFSSRKVEGDNYNYFHSRIRDAFLMGWPALYLFLVFVTPYQQRYRLYFPLFLLALITVMAKWPRKMPERWTLTLTCLTYASLVFELSVYLSTREVQSSLTLLASVFTHLKNLPL